MLLLAATTHPAAASQQRGLSISVSHRWNSAAAPGLWSPYSVTVHNSGSATFEGDLVLAPNQGYQNGAFGPAQVQSLPTYRSHVVVPNGADRTVNIYLVEAPGGYHAELHDPSGASLATAQPAPAPTANAAFAVLSDVARADQRIGAPVQSQSKINVAVAGFAQPQDFPSNAVYLAGLNGLIVDQFDVSVLSQAQLQALKDFVGLGGTLIEAGGASWRHTLLHLPSELVPMVPAQTSTASIATLADLAGLTSGTSVQVAVGQVAAWGRVGLAAPDGQPLIVEGSYGSGRVVELSFDPLSPPFDTQLDIAVAGWSQAMTRGLNGAPSGGFSPKTAFGGGFPGGNPLAGGGPGAWAPFPPMLWQVLNSAAASTSPPFGLLAGLFALYVLALSAGSYVLLKATRRRGLFWVAVPALAVAVTAGAYAVGLGGRGSDVQLAEAQVQRIGPGGVVETYSFDGVLSPRKGDVVLPVPAGTLASTALPTFGGPNSASGGTITVGASPELVITNVPVWEMRPLQALAVTHPVRYQGTQAVPVAARLHLRNGRIQGEVSNLTAVTMRDLQLAIAGAAPLAVAAELGPGSTRQVDISLPSTSAAPLGKSGPGFVGPMCGPGIPCGQSASQSFASLAAMQVSGSAGQLALIASTEPLDTMGVAQRRLAASSRSLLVEQVQVESADALGSLAPPARLVSSYPAQGSGELDAYEFQLPQGLTGGVGVSTVTYGAPAQAGAEAYDWDSGTWRPLPQAVNPGQAVSSSRLTPGETAHGTVRVRTVEDAPGQISFSLTDAK
jgi:hypothetical protein